MRVRPRRPINDDTSLKKLMRYARRGQLPSERLQTIKRAVENAVRRARVYVKSDRDARKLRDELVRLGWKP